MRPRAGRPVRARAADTPSASGLRRQHFRDERRSAWGEVHHRHTRRCSNAPWNSTSSTALRFLTRFARRTRSVLVAGLRAAVNSQKGQSGRPGCYRWTCVGQGADSGGSREHIQEPARAPVEAESLPGRYEPYCSAPPMLPLPPPGRPSTCDRRRRPGRAGDASALLSPRGFTPYRLRTGSKRSTCSARCVTAHRRPRV